MDPMSRKRKMINEYTKDLEISKLRKNLVSENHNHLFYKCLNKNNSKFLNLLIQNIKNTVPENIRKEMDSSLNVEFHKFLDANKKLKEQYTNFKK